MMSYEKMVEQLILEDLTQIQRGRWVEATMCPDCGRLYETNYAYDDDTPPMILFTATVAGRGRIWVSGWNLDHCSISMPSVMTSERLTALQELLTSGKIHEIAQAVFDIATGAERRLQEHELVELIHGIQAQAAN